MELAKQARAGPASVTPDKPASAPEEPASPLSHDGPASETSDKLASLLSSDKPASVSPADGPASEGEGPASGSPVVKLGAGQTTSGIGGTWTPPEDVRSPLPSRERERERERE